MDKLTNTESPVKSTESLLVKSFDLVTEINKLNQKNGRLKTEKKILQKENFELQLLSGALGVTLLGCFIALLYVINSKDSNEKIK
jgi:hypothetical protein